MATLVTNIGLGIITSLLSGTGTTPKFIGYGTGVVDAAVGDTALGTAAAEARTSGTESRLTTSTTNDTYRVVGTIVCTAAPKAITEVGLFDALTAGQLFMRSVFSPINLNVGDSIAFTISNQIDQG